MKILVKKKIFLWIGIAAMVLVTSAVSYANEPVTISHTLIGYTNDGPTLSLDFLLDITNNSGIPFLDAEISVALINRTKHMILEPNPEGSAVYIGDIPVSSENISATCSVQTHIILPQEEFERLLIFWELKYTDESGEPQMIIVESQPVSIQ